MPIHGLALAAGRPCAYATTEGGAPLLRSGALVPSTQRKAGAIRQRKPLGQITFSGGDWPGLGARIAA